MCKMPVKSNNTQVCAKNVIEKAKVFARTEKGTKVLNFSTLIMSTQQRCQIFFWKNFLFPGEKTFLYPKKLTFPNVPIFIEETPERGTSCWCFHASFVRE